MKPPEDVITFEEIRERAYDLWDRHHRPDGFELHFWFMAERELQVERASTRAIAGDPLGSKADQSEVHPGDPAS